MLEDGSSCNRSSCGSSHVRRKVRNQERRVMGSSLEIEGNNGERERRRKRQTDRQETHVQSFNNSLIQADKYIMENTALFRFMS